MAALGEKLRREREARGVSLREIAASTRIHENYLRALEENDYGALPGSVFVTGFLRNYATHLGLDADKIVAEFEAMKIDPPVERNLVPGVIDDDEASSFSTLVVVGLLFLVLVIYVAYVNWPHITSEPAVDSVVEKVQKPPADVAEPIKPETEKKEIMSDAEKEGQPPAAKPPVTQSPAAKQPPAAKPPVSAVTIKKPTPAATLKTKAVPRQAAVTRQTDDATPIEEYKHRLVVKARDETAWIFVLVDDEVERDLFLRPGQTIIIRGNDSILFSTGKASQIKLTLNGKPLEIKVPESDVIIRWNIPLPESE